MNGRHELKHTVNASDYAQLKARLRAVAKPDKHAGADGGYIIRSLYFDNYADKAIIDKLSGQSRREKFRLRYYNGDTSFIRLEKKSKANRLCYKEGTAITAGQCAAILAGGFECLNNPENPLMMDLYTKKAERFYAFFRVKIIPTIAPIRIIGANLTNSHSNA